MKKVEQVYECIVVGCGSRGLPLLWKMREAGGKIVALEASSRVGGMQFLVSRSCFVDTKLPVVFEKIRELPALKVWWNRSWISPTEVDWQDEDWAFVVPQWNHFFSPLQEFRVKAELLSELKDLIQLEEPVSEICREENHWCVRSGDRVYKTQQLYWTLGLKALQDCFGKKECEEFLEKNPDYQEAARDAEGVLVAQFQGASQESHFLGLPVRHEHRLYLSFVSIHEGYLECFVYLPSDILKQPKEVSFFEKSLRRTLKHTLSHLIGDLQTSTLALVYDPQGYSLASPRRLKNAPEKGIYFLNEENPEKVPRTFGASPRTFGL